MGICCESETHQVTTENKRRKKSPKSSQNDVDTEWYRSYAGKVHTAILNLHKDPKSHVHKLDRVYQDLIIPSQIVEVTTD